MAAVGARKAVERKPLSQMTTPTRTMLSRCGDADVAALIRRRAEQSMVFHVAVWQIRTRTHRRVWNATVRDLRACD
jgi:hypothetical protein